SRWQGERWCIWRGGGRGRWRDGVPRCGSHADALRRRLRIIPQLGPGVWRALALCAHVSGGLSVTSELLIDLAEMEVIHGVVRVIADGALQGLSRFRQIVALDVETPEQVEVAALAAAMGDGTLHMPQRGLAVATAPGMAGQVVMDLRVLRSNGQRRAVEVFGLAVLIMIFQHRRGG